MPTHPAPLPFKPRPGESLVERAQRLDREIAAAGGIAAHWRATADTRYERLVDPQTGEVLADRVPTR